jgi:ATP-dependent DNA helicase RecQ
MTATAALPVRDDIVERLRLRDPAVVVTGFARENLALGVVRATTADEQRRTVLALVETGEGAGIVYCRTRRSAEEYAAELTGRGRSTAVYHAGLPKRERTQVHEEFLAGRVPLIAATSAFGMGIDKPNIRWVTHVALPDSPDSYLQEIGRAGRDGEPAQAVLLYRPEDIALQRYFTGGAPSEPELAALAAALRTGTPQGRTALAEHTGLGPRKLPQLLALLEHVGAAHTVQHGRWTVPRYAPPPAEAARLALQEAERHQRLQRSRIDMMRGLAETAGCRTQALLSYFGEHLSRPCGHCDNCQAGTAKVGRATGPYPLHSAVRHASWGQGTVMRYEDDRMVVLFDEVGYKTLSVAVVQRQGLLAPA